MSYIDKLIENCEKAKIASPVNEFVLTDLSDLDAIKQAVYVIEQIDGCEEAFSDFTLYKDKKRGNVQN